MRAPAIRHVEPLPVGHPCFGCEVRLRAVCGVLDCDRLAKLRQLGWTLALNPGQPLFHEGDEATRVFTLTEGALKLYKLLPDGRRQVTGFMFPGDFLGIAVDDEHGFTVEALRNSRLCRFPRSRFCEFAESHPELERELYRVAAHELAVAQQQMVLLGRKTATERLASFFVALLERAEEATGRNQHIIDLPMSRCDIADYLGLTKETVSRELAAIKRKRIIRLEGMHRIEVLDREGIIAIAEGMVDN